MGSGLSGAYKGTRGSGASGSLMLMSPSDQFYPNISRRLDVDTNGYYDIVAHGTTNVIEIYVNGQKHVVDHRVIANIVKRNSEASGMKIRLLSCNTGKLDDGFAQNLANKLNVEVMASDKYLFAYPSGNYKVYEGKIVGRRVREVFSDPGNFRIFKPRKDR